MEQKGENKKERKKVNESEPTEQAEQLHGVSNDADKETKCTYAVLATV